MPTWLSQSPVRLLKVSKLLSWQQLKVYEDLVPMHGCLELPYTEISDELWSQTVAISWRWGAGKPASRQGVFSPMSDMQFALLRKVLTGLKEQGMQYVWLDWCCMPQYSSAASGAMIEIMRSKLLYARSGAMIIVPSYDVVPDDGVTRFVLTKAARLLQDGAHKLAERGQAADAVYGILHRGFVANGSYFCRVWTLVERMARHGRPELLCHWVPLEAWLGMVLDAMRRSGCVAGGAGGGAGAPSSPGPAPSAGPVTPTGRNGSTMTSASSLLAGAGASGAVDLEDGSAVPKVFKEMLGEEAAKLMEAIGGHWASAVKTGSIHLPEGLDAKLATLLEMATATWHTGSVQFDCPSKSWLLAYLDDAHLGKYGASATADRIWAVYSYYCWRHLDHHEPRQVVEALQDLGQVAGANGVVTLRLATRLDLELPVKLAAAVARDDAAAGQGGCVEGLAGIHLSPTELLRSALPAGEVHEAMWGSSITSQAYDKRPHQVLPWECVDPEGAGGGGCGGGGADSRLLVEAIRDHQDEADAMYGVDIRLPKPEDVGPLNSEADVATAMVTAVTGRLARLANARPSAWTCATWYQQPPAAILQCGVTGSGGEEGGGRAMYGLQQAARTASAAASSTAAASSSTSDTRCGREAFKMDLMLLLEPKTDNSSCLSLMDRSAAGAGHGADGASSTRHKRHRQAVTTRCTAGRSSDGRRRRLQSRPRPRPPPQSRPRPRRHRNLRRQR